MIQRIQSIWLLLAAICAFVTYPLVLYVGKLADGSERQFLLGDHFVLMLSIIALGVLSLVCIFLFKDRKLQFRLTVLDIVLTIGYVFLQYVMIEQFKKDLAIQTGSYKVAALLPFLMIIFLIFAARAIYKDEKLVKSLDRLR
jgi:magnesium-transporting ATPase (P-type)